MTNMTCHLDSWLNARGITHPVITPVVRNEILCTGLFLLLGILFFVVSAWFFWFSIGLALMALTFYSLSGFFLRRGLGAYSSGILILTLLRWSCRLILIACVLYIALARCAAPASAILGGLVCASVLALATFAAKVRQMS